MKHHLLAVGGAAQDYSAGLVTVPIISDILMRQNSNILQLSDDWTLFAARLAGTGLTRFRISSAQSRIRGYPNLQPFGATVLGGDLPTVADLRDNPISLHNGENVTLQATNGGAQTTLGCLWLTRDTLNTSINMAGLRWISFTSAVTSVANAWSNAGNVVLDDDIEAGNYNVYGLKVSEATTYFARLIFKNQVERPGCLAVQAQTQRSSELTNGGVGLFGQFQSITPPFIEVVANASAAITPAGYLLVGKA